jgi:transposase
MARYSKALTVAAGVRFLEALRGGALVGEAAALAGAQVSTLYCRRGRDPLFAAAWEAAVALSCAGSGGQPAAGGEARKPMKRRVRLCARRRAALLRHVGETCDTKAAAAAAGVHKATVYRAMKRDAGLAADHRAALRRGYDALAREAGEREAARRERWRAWEINPVGEPSHNFDHVMRLLQRYDRPDGSIGPRFVRRGRMKRMDFDEAIALLDRRLRALDCRSGQ